MIESEKVRGIIYNQIFYFTNWTVLLILLHKFSHKYFNLLFLSFFVLIVSTYVFYINNNFFPFSFRNEVLGLYGTYKDLMHIIIHILPLAFILSKYGSYYILKKKIFHNILPTFLLIVIYLFFVNFTHLYMIGWKDVTLLFVVTMLTYLSFYEIMKSYLRLYG